MGLYGSQYDYVICITLITTLCVSLIASFQTPLYLPFQSLLSVLLLYHKVLLKRRVGDASLYQMALFLSMIGFFTTVTLWPIILILHFLHVEVLTDIPWGYICASSALGVIFNFSINFGIAYTFPLFISLGTILGIPLNAIVDVIVRHVDFLNWKFTATDLIVGGFLLMLVPPSDSVCVERNVRKAVTCKCCEPVTSDKD